MFVLMKLRLKISYQQHDHEVITMGSLDKSDSVPHSIKYVIIRIRYDTKRYNYGFSHFFNFDVKKTLFFILTYRND